MPLFTVLIAPLLSLYIKYRITQFAVKIIMFGLIYAFFKTGMQFAIDTIMIRLNTLDLPCMVTYVLNQLDLFSMLNFGLSFMATAYIGNFLYNSMMKMI